MAPTTVLKVLVALSCVLGGTHGFATRGAVLHPAGPTATARSSLRPPPLRSAEAGLDEAPPVSEEEQLPQIGSRYRVMGAPLTRQEHEEIGYEPRYANLKGESRNLGRTDALANGC